MKCILLGKFILQCYYEHNLNEFHFRHFIRKKFSPSNLIDGKWTKNTTTFGRRPAVTSAVAKKKEIWFPYESRYRTPEPQDASCRFSVHKNFFCGYYKSNNEKNICTPRLIIFVLTHILQHFFACSTANLQIKLKP